MLITTTLSVLSLPLFLAAAAQKIVTVQVASGGFVYNPNNITAPNGTIISFDFPKSPGGGIGHSVTQSSFSSPCTYLQDGFNSGVVTNATQWNLTITDDSNPIWFYCKEATHCGMGMVGGINTPATGNTTDAFRAAAIALGTSEPAQNLTASAVSSGIGAQVATPTAPGSPSGTTSGRASATSSTTPSNGASQLTFGVAYALLAGSVAVLAV